MSVKKSKFALPKDNVSASNNYIASDSSLHNELLNHSSTFNISRSEHYLIAFLKNLEDNNKKLNSDNEMYISKIIELEKLRREKHDAIWTSFICTVITVLGGFLLGEKDKFLFLPEGYNFYFGLFLIIVSCFFGFFSPLLSDLIWSLKHKYRK